jgi:hypothetical protein
MRTKRERKKIKNLQNFVGKGACVALAVVEQPVYTNSLMTLHRCCCDFLFPSSVELLFQKKGPPNLFVEHILFRAYLANT